jgi:hypothetical protein
LIREIQEGLVLIGKEKIKNVVSGDADIKLKTMRITVR